MLYNLTAILPPCEPRQLPAPHSVYWDLLARAIAVSQHRKADFLAARAQHTNAEEWQKAAAMIELDAMAMQADRAMTDVLALLSRLETAPGQSIAYQDE